ncbi:MAG: hypothetical protein PUC30_04285 [Lachnospiraceae bacterium]|nr:hypothetical protein [Lachnospiraceae bacterium]
MRKKRCLYAVVGLLCLMLCSGVGCKKEREISVNQGKDLCNDISRFKAAFPGGSYMSFCDSGFSFVENNLLMFHEYESDLIYPLCSEAYCAHEPKSLSNPDPKCEAAKSDVTSAVVYGHDLYVFQESEFGKTIVSVRNLLESGYREIVELPYSLTVTVPGIYNMISDEKALLVVTDIGDKDVMGVISQQDYPTVVLELDLKSGKYKELFRIEAGPQIRTISRVKNGIGLYFLHGTGEIQIGENGELIQIPGELYDYYYYVDMETKEWKEIKSLMPDGGLRKEHADEDKERIEFVGFSEKGIVVKKNQSLFWMTPETEELEEFWTLPEGYNTFSAGGLGEKTLTMYMGKGNEGKRGLLMIETGEFKEVEYGENFAGLEYFGDNYYCCYYFHGDNMQKRLIHYHNLVDGSKKALFEWVE